MKCKDCAYFYADCNDFGTPINKPYCHYFEDDDCAPCQIVDDNYSDDYNFDNDYLVTNFIGDEFDGN